MKCTELFDTTLFRCSQTVYFINRNITLVIRTNVCIVFHNNDGNYRCHSN